MVSTGAILHLSRNEQGFAPLLEPILFDPAALWFSCACLRTGVSRFFVLCHPDDVPAARPCFPEDTIFADPEGPGTPAAQEEFSRQFDKVLVFSSEDAAQYAGAEVSVKRLREKGVRFIDPKNAYIGPQVEVDEGTVILPGTILRGKTVIGKGCTVGPNTMITDCQIGDAVTVNASQLVESVVEDGVIIGPFAYIRPNCRIRKGAKLGDFVEIKNSDIGEGTKINHLTYVGDADVGQKVNFGCGTVTVNYDGVKKFRTVIGDHAFIGCNTNLVAPVEVGEGAYTAAGSTITEDVPAESLAIARSRQEVKKNWVKRRRG